MARRFSSTRCIACRASTRWPRSRPRSRKVRHSRSRSSTCACRRGSTARKPRPAFARSIPNINLVIVTGFSDFSPIEISKAAGPADKIFYIAKPFEIAEVVQTATALGHRWRVDRDLRRGDGQAARAVGRTRRERIQGAASRDARFADRSAQPARLRQGADRQGARRRHVRDRDGRSRPLQAGQRHARSSGGRRADPRDLRDPPRQRTRRRDRRAAGRRRVRRTVRHRRRTGRGDGVRPYRRGVRHQLPHSRPFGPGRRFGRRRRRVGRRRARSGRRHAPRRPRAQRRQEIGTRRRPRVRRNDGRKRPLPPPDRRRAGPGDRAGRIEPRLSADRRRSRHGGRRVRSAVALEHRGIRADQPGFVHPDRRGIEPYPRSRRLGARRSAQGAARLARPVRVGQFLAAPVPPPEFRRAT